MSTEIRMVIKRPPVDSKITGIPYYEDGLIKGVAVFEVKQNYEQQWKEIIVFDEKSMTVTHPDWGGGE